MSDKSFVGCGRVQATHMLQATIQSLILQCLVVNPLKAWDFARAARGCSQEVSRKSRPTRPRPAGSMPCIYGHHERRGAVADDDAGQGGGGKRMGTSLAFSYIAESPPPKAPVSGQGAGGAPRCPASGMETRRAETFAAPLTTVRPVGGDAKPPTTQGPQDHSQASPIEVCLSIKACNYSIRGIYYL